MEFQQGPDRIFLTDGEGRLTAEITFHPDPGGAMVLDHTFVDGSLRGQGVAGKLVEAAVARLKAEGHPIAATCSYAVKWLAEHPQ